MTVALEIKGICKHFAGEQGEIVYRGGASETKANAQIVSAHLAMG
jgi:hypothetical protein